MATSTPNKLSEMPEEMLSFTLQTALRNGPRIGQLTLRNRIPISTPDYVAITSRGVVPHLSHDNVARHVKFDSLYFGFEDFIEKQPPKKPPIFLAAGDSPLRNFTNHSKDAVLILGPRRVPAVESPASNSKDKLAICTAVGFRQLGVDDYISSGNDLMPDILLAPGDIVSQMSNQKRVEKMGDRTATWIRDATTHKQLLREQGRAVPAFFAPILPVGREQQSYYIRELVDDFKEHLEGLYVHDAQSVVDLPESLESLPRLAFSNATSPSKLLYEISLGVDLFILPFIASATDSGIALDFQFPPPESSNDATTPRRQIGIDLWNPAHATDVSPFVDGCACYACRKHHRAYLHHLLSAKEMLAWVLLQMHNHSIMDDFFRNVRASIADGTFESKRLAFERYYEPELPANQGSGPRVRGYQFKSTGKGEPKKNVKAFNKLDDMAEALEEAPVPSPDVDAKELEGHGLGKAE